MSVIRGTSLEGYRALVTELGVDPDPLLLRAGIDPADVGRFDAFVPYIGIVHAVESAAAATGVADFGRRLGNRQGIEILGPVGVAARTTGTVGEALATFEQYLHAYSPAIGVSITPEGESAFLSFRIVMPHPPAAPHTVEMSLGVMRQVLRFLLGAEYAPLSVRIPHRPLGAEAEYAAVYAAPAAFGGPDAGMLLRGSDLSRRLVRDAMAHDVVRRYLDSVVGRDRSSTVRSVRELIRRVLPTGAVTAETIAEQVRLHPKTLRRRLVAEGTTFSAVVDDVRRELTEQYLRETDMTLAHLARELGYAEQSVLSRSCRRWFGEPPATVRVALRSGGVAQAVSPGVENMS